MSARSRIASILRNLFRRERVERDLDDELRAYVEMAAEEKRSAGLTDHEARLLASYVPVRRAMRIDPLAALRQE